MHFPIYHENLMFVSIIYAMDDATNSLLSLEPIIYM
jgi:hypothetical protein